MTDTKTDPLRDALKPFADFADPRNKIPPDTILTAGSAMARKQITMADCYAAKAALALPPAAPLRDADPEPVAWTVLSTDADRIRIWWRDKDLAEKWAAEHSLPLIPLYAKPFATADFLALASAPQPTVPSDFERVFIDACDEIGCAHDNEALLQAIAQERVDRAAVIEECATASTLPLTDEQRTAGSQGVGSLMSFEQIWTLAQKTSASAIRALANAKGDGE